MSADSMTENGLRAPRPVVDRDLTEITARLQGELKLLSGKHVVLTGALGFIGRYIAETFRLYNYGSGDEPIRLTGVDQSSALSPTDRQLWETSSFSLLKCDVAFEEPDLGESCDFIIHAAGVPSPRQYADNPLATIDAAVGGVRAMLVLARREGSRLLFFSSSEVYGDPGNDNIPTRESFNGNVSCTGPRSCYDESKRMGETLVSVFARHYGVEAVIVRPFNVYGPGMRPDDGRVVSSFVSSVLAGEPITVYGDGTQTRSFCYVTDAIVGFIKALVGGRAGEAYNIGQPVPEISVAELADHVVQHAPGAPATWSTAHYPSGYPQEEPLRRCPDIEKAGLQLGFVPQVSLEVGLERFMSWAQQSYLAEGVTHAPWK